jgi:hypothetical protein
LDKYGDGSMASWEEELSIGAKRALFTNLYIGGASLKNMLQYV